MSTIYVRYPQSGGGGGSSGSSTGVSYVVGPLDGAAANNQGGTIGSYTFYQQSATSSFPGLVSSANQTFSGAKSFSPGISVTGSISATGVISGSNISGSNTSDISLAAVGAVPNANGASIAAGQVLNLQAADGTNPGALTAVAQTVGGTKTFSSPPVLSGFTTGSLLFIGSGSAVMAQDNANIFWDDTTNRLGVGTAVPDSALTVAQSAFIAPPAATVVHIVGTVGSTSRMAMDAYNNTPGNAPGFILRRSRGNAGAPAGIVTDDNIGFFGASGYGTTGFALTTAGTLTFKSSQTWTDTNQGCYFHINVNANSTSSSVERFRVNQNGIIQISAYAGTNGVLTTGSGGVVSMGSVSLTNQVSGILPAANLPSGTIIGSVSLTNQVVGVLPVANSSRLDQLVGSVSLTTQVVGILPQGNIPTTLNIGSVTQTSSAGGLAYTVRWPGSIGSGSYSALTNDGVGNLYWKSLYSPRVATISSGAAQTYTAGTDCVGLKITVTGAGGGGGGTATGAGTGGGAGGAAGTATKWITGRLSGMTLFVTIGDGGAGGANSGGNGGLGADSVVGSSNFITLTTLVGSGGAGGNGNTSAAAPVAGGDGGASSGGDLNMTGGAGSAGLSGLPTFTGGVGGASFWGGGGPGGTGGNAGANGRARGSGAGGASTNAGNTAGGKGAQGQVVIEEYY